MSRFRTIRSVSRTPGRMQRYLRRNLKGDAYQLLNPTSIRASCTQSVREFKALVRAGRADGRSDGPNPRV